MLKKVTTLLLAMLLSFTACTGGKEAQTTKAESSTAVLVSAEKRVIRLSTTTSVDDSGLLPYLQSYFEAETGYKLEITANGTGAAIKLGETGDCDVLLVHSKDSEEQFVQAGYGVKRIPFMYNYFVIAGPQADTAKIADCKNAAEAFERIAKDGKTKFVSRGDDSGTNKAELKIWKALGITPGKDDAWYVSTGSGMGTSLTKASEMQAYILTDKGTFLSMEKNLDIKILLEKGDDMKNTYSLIAVNPDKHEGINSEGANAFIQWMTKAQTLKLIGDYGKTQYGQPLFFVLEG
jgi:tungstate transport system substrate-binding protein